MGHYTPSVSVRPRNASGHAPHYPITPNFASVFPQEPAYPNWPNPPSMDAQSQPRLTVGSPNYNPHPGQGSLGYVSASFPTVPTQGQQMPIVGYSLPPVLQGVVGIGPSSTPQLPPGTSSGAEYPGPSKPFQCPQCGLAFDRNYRLVTHMNTHSNNKPFVCGGSCGDELW